ncbi:hypothetical protein PsorP6_015810 [Peronosclerospora sorghi]|uniref:Uncharacterized protein n=1 Tax=Peronosclerospora sorghi TaxID=230839 RepID=A0ACC0WMJ1_9STRA|nr:hypothetical protein PsorP6_015810 [Peronosclerospora sorghi]
MGSEYKKFHAEVEKPEDKSVVRFSQARDFTKSGQACQCLRELKHYDPNTISKCIRIVNCEGVKIKETPKALKILNDIVEEFNLFDK